MRGHTARIFDLLAEHEDGLTTAEICALTGIKYTSAFNATNRNRQFVIDRWVPNSENMRWVPVWALKDGVEGHAPQPDIPVFTYLRTQERRAA